MRPNEPAGAGNGRSALTTPVKGLDLRDLWNFTLRNRRIIGSVFTAAFLTAVVLTLRATPVYESEASIRIEDSDPLNPLASMFGDEKVCKKRGDVPFR